MAVVWSHEFLVALLCFLVPMAIGALLVYRRVVKSHLVRRRKRKAVTEATVRQVLEQAQPAVAAPVVQPAIATPVTHDEPAAAPLPSLQQSLENLRRTLVEFRGSLQHSRSALGELQDCDCQFSEDLGRASEVMHHAFSK